MKTRIFENCPHCETEVSLAVDLQRDGYIQECPVCHSSLFLCDECLHPDESTNGALCNWIPTYCKRVPTKHKYFIVEVKDTQLKKATLVVATHYPTDSELIAFLHLNENQQIVNVVERSRERIQTMFKDIDLDKKDIHILKKIYVILGYEDNSNGSKFKRLFYSSLDFAKLKANEFISQNKYVKIEIVEYDDFSHIFEKYDATLTAKVKFNTKCFASISGEIDVPTTLLSEPKKIREYINEHIFDADYDCENLVFEKGSIAEMDESCDITEIRR